MNTSSKKRNSLIAIFVSICLMVGAVFGIIFMPKISSVKAADYNYGEFNEKGYYSLNGVTFYGVKIKTVTNVIAEYEIASNRFTIDGIEYTISGSTISYTENDESKTISITDNSFVLNGANYSIGENKVTKLEYWPDYEIVKDEAGNPEIVKFGESVLLKEGEAILLCFARQTDDKTGFVFDEEGKAISRTVDYLKATVLVDGESERNELENSLAGGGDTDIKEFGYIIDPRGEFSESGKLGVNKGREGLVEFSTSEYEVGGMLQSFSFMFYAFNYETYHRFETLNPNASSSIKERPNTTITATDYVTDSATQKQYFAEYFYYYSNQNLPYLEFDMTRYEVSITKTIHRTSTKYNFSLNNEAISSQITEINNKITTIVEQIGENKLVQRIEQALSTMDIYARGLRVEDRGNGVVRIYFEDLGQYTISYSAVYYKDGAKTVLENLNTDSRTDLLTIVGTEATYQDSAKGQTPFRNESNTIYADLTGTSFNFSVDDSGNGTLTTSATIASTNQPPINLLFNAPVGPFSVYYSKESNGTFMKTDNYSYTSSFQNPGYYVVIVSTSFDGYKSWVSASNSTRYETLTTQQTYVFQIKEQTSNLELYVLGDDGNVIPEANRQRVYSDNFVKNGIQIIEFEKANEFDSQIYFELTKQGFSQTAVQAQTIILPNQDHNELSQAQIDFLASYGLTKFDGYYVLKPTEGISIDGEYHLSLRFGNSGRETVSFKLDTEAIGGITAYTATSVYGTEYYSTNLISSQGDIALTNKAFTLLWQEKASKAKITAKFIRFAVSPKVYNQLDNDYIINSTWLATDFSIILTESNPETLFSKAESLTKVKAESVLSYNGLYIFMLEDEAGNIAYYSVLIDNTTPTVLQKTMNSGESYKKVGRVNNVSEATTIFFGSHKAISFMYKDALLVQNGESYNELLNKTTKASNYLKNFFEKLGEIDSAGRVSTDSANGNLFLSIPIVSIFESVGEIITKLDNSIIEQGFYNRLAPLDENNRLRDYTYFYQIFDASNVSSRTPTKTHRLRFNTDQTGLIIFTERDNLESEITNVNSETADDYTYRNKYYVPTGENTVYLTWDNLMPIESLGAFVDIENNGLTCLFYSLIYDKTLNSYVYSDVPITVDLSLSNLTDEELSGGYVKDDDIKVQIPINVVNGSTVPGKYVITRKYSPASGAELGNLGNDFETISIVFFVDRTNIISPTDANGERVGEYTYITTFDGGQIDNKEFFNQLYRQSQTSLNYILQTNQLPVGFYIPLSKYGTVYGVTNGILGTTPLSLEEVQRAESGSIKFIDLVNFTNLDVDEEIGLTSTYSPYSLNVVLISPETTIINGRTVNVYYYYSYVPASGYFLISGYSFGELGVGEIPTPITNYRSFITNNPVTGKSEYSTGNYVLQIGCVLNRQDNSYLQTFNVVVNVFAEEPEYDINAEYSDLNNIESREIESDGTNYWTNSNEIRFVWTNSSNQFQTPIDLSQISLTYFIGSRRTVVPNANNGERILVRDIESDEYWTYVGGVKQEVEQADIENSIYVIKIEKRENSYSFIANLPKEIARVTIKMAYEKYSTDTGRYYRPYYPSGSYEAEKTIIIDINAPTESISYLKNNDKTVEGILDSLLRFSDDSRYSKSAIDGIFKFYTYVVKSNYFVELSKQLETNASTETKTFYYRGFKDKYTIASYKETGIPYDKSSKGDNIFSEYFALNNDWTKVDKEIEDFQLSGYFEVVELDLAGNMTIYSVYIGENRGIEINFDRFTGTVENGNIRITKETDGAQVQINGEINLENSLPVSFSNIFLNPVVVSSYDYLKLNWLTFSGDNYYRYLKLNILGTNYYITPETFVNIGSESDAKIACNSVYNVLGEKIDLEDLLLRGQNSTHNINIVDTVNTISTQAAQYSIQAKVSTADARLTDNGGAIIRSDVSGILDSEGNPVVNNLALIITTPINPSLYIDRDSIRIFKIDSNNNYVSYRLNGENAIYLYESITPSSEIKYFYLRSEPDFTTSTFYILYKDNFGNEYESLVEYRSSNFDRFEGEYDITESTQSKTDILVSGPVAVNVSNIFEVSITDINGNNVAGKFTEISSSLLGGSYTQYQLSAPADVLAGYVGGKITFKISLSYRIPDGILDELAGLYSQEQSGAIEIIYVTIYNQFPNIKVTNSNGDDISNALFGKEITQSEAITISFGSGNELSDAMGYTSKVFLRLRGSAEGYIEISSPYVVSEPGIYDLYIQNFDENGNALEYVLSKDFVISSLDVMFYNVVKTNELDQQEIVSPTGKALEYTSGRFASYHYIVNTSSFDVLTNGVNVTKTLIHEENNTTVYEISSSGGTIYKAVIAITVVNQTNDIFVSNPFIWYLGTVYSSPSESNYLTSTSKEIYLCADDVYDEITLRWSSYYSITQNEIVCYISSDDGKTWNVAKGVNNGTTTSLTLSKSSSYLFRFEDKAGNIQLFSSSSGFPSSTTKINFIRSVIINVNNDTPIENAVYNGSVTISLPINTTHFYSTTPSITVYRNNERFNIETDSLGNYVFTLSGSYKVVFSAKVEGGTRDLNEDVLTFSIINANDSRWAFNYVNYNNYNISSIKFNGVEIPEILRNRSLSVASEINISAFDSDEIGNKWFNNGIYTIVMEYEDDALGTKSFEFSFWLNSANPPISVSLPEGQSTTGKVTIEFNRGNLYEVLGDCYIQINNNVAYVINSTTAGQTDSPHELSNIGSYYIQVYTSSGKLVYSYHVNINEPLNTVTIILIVVSVIVVAAGLLIFFLLRKKMQVR